MIYEMSLFHFISQPTVLHQLQIDEKQVGVNYRCYYNKLCTPKMFSRSKEKRESKVISVRKWTDRTSLICQVKDQRLTTRIEMKTE